MSLVSFSPEVVQSQPCGEKADVWASGCILYQMATLQPPFYSSNMLALATKVGPASTWQLLLISILVRRLLPEDETLPSPLI